MSTFSTLNELYLTFVSLANNASDKARMDADLDALFELGMRWTSEQEAAGQGATVSEHPGELLSLVVMAAHLVSTHSGTVTWMPQFTALVETLQTRPFPLRGIAGWEGMDFRHPKLDTLEHALFALGHLPTFELFCHRLDTHEFHEVLDQRGNAWVQAGRVDLMAFAKDTGYAWSEPHLFLARDGVTLEWLFELGFAADAVDSEGKTLREKWSRSGYTQKDVATLTKTLSKYEALDPTIARRAFFQSLWKMSRSVLKREAKTAGVDLADENIRTELWTSFTDEGSHYASGIAALELLEAFPLQLTDRHRNGGLIALMLALAPPQVDSKKAPNIERHWVALEPVWAKMHPRERIVEMARLKGAKMTQENVFKALANATAGLNAPSIEDGVLLLNTLAALNKASRSRYNEEGNLPVFNLPESTTYHYGSRRQPDSYWTNREREHLLNFLFALPDEAFSEARESLGTIVAVFLAHLAKINPLVPAFSPMAQDLITPGKRGKALIVHWSEIGAFEFDEAGLANMEKFRQKHPDIYANLEKSMLISAMPEAHNNAAAAPKRRL
jgi:hypothetical protein